MLKVKNWSEFFATQNSEAEGSNGLHIARSDDFHMGNVGLEWPVEGEGERVGVQFFATAAGQNSEFFQELEGVVVIAMRTGAERKWHLGGNCATILFRFESARLGAAFENYFPGFEAELQTEVAVASIPLASFAALCNSPTLGITIGFSPPELFCDESHRKRLRALQSYIERGVWEKTHSESAQKAELN